MKSPNPKIAPNHYFILEIRAREPGLSIFIKNCQVPSTWKTSSSTNPWFGRMLLCRKKTLWLLSDCDGWNFSSRKTGWKLLALLDRGVEGERQFRRTTADCDDCDGDNGDDDDNCDDGDDDDDDDVDWQFDRNFIQPSIKILISYSKFMESFFEPAAYTPPFGYYKHKTLGVKAVWTLINSPRFFFGKTLGSKEA